MRMMELAIKETQATVRTRIKGQRTVFSGHALELPIGGRERVDRNIPNDMDDRVITVTLQRNERIRETNLRIRIRYLSFWVSLSM